MSASVTKDAVAFLKSFDFTCTRTYIIETKLVDEKSTGITIDLSCIGAYTQILKKKDDQHGKTQVFDGDFSRIYGHDCIGKNINMQKYEKICINKQFLG